MRGALTLGFVVATSACAAARPPEPPVVTAKAQPPPPTVVLDRPKPRANTCLSAPKACTVPRLREDAVRAIVIADRAFAREPGTAAPPANEKKLPPAERRKREAEAFRPRALTPEEENLVSTVGDYAACHADDRELAFELGSRLFSYRRWSESALLFLRVADRGDDDLAVEALLRGLEAINVLGSQFSKTDCFDTMEDLVMPAVDRFCDDDDRAAHPDRVPNCVILTKIKIDILRLHLQSDLVSRESTK